MKPLHLLYIAFAAGLALASCSKDDDDAAPEQGQQGDLWQGELGAAPYEADAVCYTMASGPYKMIELTASGNYIVQENTSSSYPGRSLAEQPRRKGSLMARLHKDQAPSRGSGYGGIYFGTFTRNSDGSYTLNGYGRINGFSNGTLSVTVNTGTTYNIPASVAPKAFESALTNRLCRTWYTQSATEETYRNGAIVDIYTYPLEELKEEYNKFIIITKAGTYVDIDWDDTIDCLGSWEWSDTNTQLLHWWEDEYLYGEWYRDEGYEQAIFLDNKVTFSGWYDDDDGNPIHEMVTCVAL